MPEAGTAFSRVFLGLPVVRQLEVLAGVGLLAEWVQEVFADNATSSDAAADWAERHLRHLLPALVRTVELTDDDIRLLVLEDHLRAPSGGPAGQVAIRVAFTGSGGEDGDPPRGALPDGVFIMELAAVSVVLSELFVSLAAANRPFGLELELPRVAVSGHSVQVATDHGLLTSGLGLVAACAAAVAPGNETGLMGGVSVAAASLLDFALNWRVEMDRMREIEDDRIRLRRMPDPSALLQSKRLSELELRIRELELEKEWLITELQFGPKDAQSSLVPLQTVIDEAGKRALSIEYAHHILNRTLPRFLALRRFDPHVEVSHALL
jgi:hypothetical protein